MLKKPLSKLALLHLAGLLIAACSTANAGKPHGHGTVQLDLVVEASEETIFLRAPLEQPAWIRANPSH